MSFKITLKVAGRELNELGCSYALKQDAGATCRPSAETPVDKAMIAVLCAGAIMSEMPDSEVHTSNADNISIDSGTDINDWV